MRGNLNQGVKKSEDLVPKFYWKHRDVKPFLFADEEELSVQGEDVMPTVEEGSSSLDANRTIDNSIKPDEQEAEDARAKRVGSAGEPMKVNLMSKFSS
jgi:hypothetical protein